MMESIALGKGRGLYLKPYKTGVGLYLKTYNIEVRTNVQSPKFLRCIHERLITFQRSLL